MSYKYSKFTFSGQTKILGPLVKEFSCHFGISGLCEKVALDKLGIRVGNTPHFSM